MDHDDPWASYGARGLVVTTPLPVRRPGRILIRCPFFKETGHHVGRAGLYPFINADHRLLRTSRGEGVAVNTNLSAIGQIAITVSNVDSALGFYQEILGLPLLFRVGEGMAFLQAGDVRLLLTTPQGAGAVGANSILYFRVNDLEGMYAGLVARGATPDTAPHLVAKMPDHELWMAFVRDPDGNLVGLMEEKPLAQ